MTRRAALLLLPIGPLLVGFLRFLYPGYTADTGAEVAKAALVHHSRQSAVLWLGLAAMLTLVPGIYAARPFLPATRLRSWAVGLVVAGYLCLPVLVASDLLAWVGADQHLDPALTGKLIDGWHPAFDIGLGIFIVGHVLGTVLLGIACLRSGLLPTGICWALIISQPLHFVTTVFLGLPWVDLVAWTMTAVAMAAIAAGLARDPQPTEVLLPRMARSS
jgi:hypothetical protein